jgi:hypothetical protein
MSTEVDNLHAPYSSLVYIKVWFSQQDYQADVNSNFTTQHYGQGSGTLIGRNDPKHRDSCLRAGP